MDCSAGTGGPDGNLLRQSAGQLGLHARSLRVDHRTGILHLFNNVSLFSCGFCGSHYSRFIGLHSHWNITLYTFDPTQNTRHAPASPALPGVDPVAARGCPRIDHCPARGSVPELSTWLLLLAGYDLLFFAVGVMVYDKILEE